MCVYLHHRDPKKLLSKLDFELEPNEPVCLTKLMLFFINELLFLL